MIGRFPYLIEQGNFIRIKGHRVQDRYRDQWWKVTAIEGTSILLVNRHGETGRWSTQDRGSKCFVWQPGDPQEDDQ